MLITIIVRLQKILSRHNHILATNLFFPGHLHVSFVKSLNNSVVQPSGEIVSSEYEGTESKTFELVL